MTSVPDESAALVFGASGFIGRWVVRELLRGGHHVVGVVRDAGRGRDAFAGWSRAPVLEQADLTTPGEGSALIRRMRPDVVYNLAGYGVDREERDERTAERINHALVTELAIACAPTGRDPGARLVHVGSALEYGTAGGVLSEAMAPEPTTVYGRTKLAGTAAVSTTARTHGTRGLTARLFTVFGDGEHRGRLFPSLVAAAHQGTELQLTDGRQRRDFAWAGHIADLLVRLSRTPFVPGEIVNVASGRMHEVAEFVRECAAQLRIPAERLQFGALPTRPEEMRHEGVDVQRLRALIGRPATENLAEAIALALRTPLGL